MTSLLDTLRRRSGGQADLVDRLAGLSEAVEAGRGRLDTHLVEQAGGVVARAGDRLRLSSEHTVVALAGATGSGKSSLFNALCGLDLAAVGVKRPTTSWALACAWGPDGAGELLDWLGIPKRHQVNRTGMLDESAADRSLQGLVLLDLPDHDSTEVSHHLEVERLVQLADALVWVLDPQKYADAALHDRFLRPLHSHADVMMAVLNHVDEIPADGVQACLADVRRLLDADGLEQVPVFATSARRGDGVPELRAAIAERVSAKGLARERLAADIRSVAAQLAEQTGDADPVDVRVVAGRELHDACADAAGVAVIVDAVDRAATLRGRRATGWPPTSWLSRLRRDPVKRLHVGEGDDAAALTSDLKAFRTRVPLANPVQRARVDSAVRDLADEVADGMAQRWSDAVRDASVTRIDRLATALDEAVAATDLGIARRPWWWAAAQALQWALLAAAVAGGLWLLALATSVFAASSTADAPTVWGIALPSLLLFGGLAAGVVLAIGCRVAVRVSARRKARRAGRRLREAIERVTDEIVVDPVQAEVTAYVTTRDGLRAALRR